MLPDFLKDNPALSATLSAIFGFIFAAGLYKQSVESRLEAHGKEIVAINDELRFRLTIRTQIMNEFAALHAENALMLQRLSRIEGKMEGRR